MRPQDKGVSTYGIWPGAGESVECRPLEDAAKPNEQMECRDADDSDFWDYMARKVYSKTPRKATCRVGIFKNCYIVDFFCASGDACTTTARLLILLAGTNVPLSRMANAAN